MLLHITFDVVRKGLQLDEVCSLGVIPIDFEHRKIRMYFTPTERSHLFLLFDLLALYMHTCVAKMEIVGILSNKLCMFGQLFILYPSIHALDTEGLKV